MSSKTFVLQKQKGEDSFGFRLLHRPGDEHKIVDHIKEQSPADRCGLKPGMFLVAVNSKSIANKTMDQVTAMIRSFPGSQLVFECLVDDDTNAQVYDNIDLETDSDSDIETWMNNAVNREASVDTLKSSLTTSNQTPSETAVSINSSIKATESPKSPVVKKESKEKTSAKVKTMETSLEKDEKAKTKKKRQAPTKPVEKSGVDKPKEQGGSTVLRRSSTAAKVSPVIVQTPARTRHYQEYHLTDQPYPLIYHHLKKWPGTKTYGFSIEPNETDGKTF